MSYDLMVFRTESAPNTRTDFMKWYQEQAEWKEDHSYDDPAHTSPELRNWFMEMIQTFPAMNGPYASDDSDDELDDEYITDYCIGNDVIYVGFNWSVAEKAYEKMKATAEKYKVGFYDTSADDGDILFPDAFGKNKPIDNPNNLSSIQQIKSWAKPGQENFTIREIVYDRVGVTSQANRLPKKWWQFWK